MSSTPHPPSIERLVEHREWVRRIARTMVQDDASADDLVQDAYVTALAHPPRADGWRAWMRRVLRNRSHNVHRESLRRAAREASPPGRDVERPTHDVVAEADAHRHVVDAVMDLDEPLRSAVLLRYFEDLPPEEVARRTETPLETTRSRLRRARTLLRDRLDREHGGRAAWLAPLVGGGVPTPGAAPRPRDARPGSGAVGALFGGLLVKQPLAAAVLVLLVVTAGAWLAVRSPDAEPPAGPPAPVATTDADPATSRPRARVRAVEVAPSGRTADAGASGDTSGADDSRERAAAGPPARRITGRVEDAGGRPVAGAAIAARHVDVPIVRAAAAAAGAPDAQPEAVPPAAQDATVYESRTGDDGTFAIDVPASAPPLTLFAGAAGFAPRNVPLSPGDDDVVLRLHRAVALRVRLLGRGGSPIAGRWIDVRDEVRSGATIGRAATDADGFALFGGLPGGALVSVNTDAEGRAGGIRTRIALAEDGESSLELRDTGVRRLHVSAVVEGPAVPVAGLLVETADGTGEIRPWPGGDTATMDVPDGATVLTLVTAAGRGRPVQVAPDADEVTLRVRIPDVRWVEVEIGALDPRAMSLAGGRDASELFHAGDLSPFASGGRLRLPFVERAEYALRRPDGTERLLGAFTEGRVVLAEPPPRVAVRVLPSSGGGFPAGVRVVAAPVLRSVRLAGEEVTGEAPAGGAVSVSLIPGITYGMLVSAPGAAAARVEHRPGPEGGEVRVALGAGGPLRLRAPGVDAATKASAVSFPGFARLPARIDEGAVGIDGAGDGWTLVMAGGAAYLVNAGGGTEGRVAPDVAGFPPEVRGNGAGVARTFLIGLEPLSAGVHAVGLVGVPLPVPAGRYVPVEWREGEIVVYAPVDLSASARAWTRPTDADVTWTQGVLEGEVPRDLVIDTPAGAVPVGRLTPGRTSRWRSAAAAVRVDAPR